MGEHQPERCEGEAMMRSALISNCGLYRYRLTRQWNDAPFLWFVMLNPSTADASVDDPTIRRCIRFAQREGAGGMSVANLFAYRSTNPAALRKVADPFGPDNDREMRTVALEASRSGMPVICAWGTGAGRSPVFIPPFHGARLMCLGKTKDGHPRHPLYVRSDQPLELFP